ncbi:MAG TPA: hypothetical protein VLT36_21550 [Candidatus Dormibacteraeota bacterium]|nr:hypothetical protein [Candidatus Dormibacteraeota bacterium]
MLHIWLIPALIVLAIVLGGFYLVIKGSGGSGVRTSGRTVVDKPFEDENPPPS